MGLPERNVVGTQIPMALATANSVSFRHQWAWLRERYWQCCDCLKVCRSLQEPVKGTCTQISGLETTTLRARGHKCINLACSDGALLVACLYCHAYNSHGRIKGLGDRCMG